MPDVLDAILERRKEHVAAAKRVVSLSDMEKKAVLQKPPLDFFSSVVQENRISLIAEMKRQSPSAGEIRPGFDPSAVAKEYQMGGAAAISVLTEPDRFGGRIDDITSVRAASNLPILRKDFIFDPYQIFEARAAGADAILLISEMLAPDQLRELVQCAQGVGLEPLVEVFLESSIPAAINSTARLIGINTRNLRTLQMNPDNVIRLSRIIPRDRSIVAESGIKTPEDVVRLKAIRVSTILVGESILKSQNLTNAVHELAEAGRKE